MSEEKPPSRKDGKQNPEYARWYRANNLEEIRRKQREYWKTDKGRATRKRYLETDEGKAVLKKCRRNTFVKSVKSGAYADHILYNMTDKEIYG